MKIVLENSAQFLSTCPSFLALNLQKSIQASTVKTRLAEWTQQVIEDRNGWATGAAAYDQCVTHPEWKKMIIQMEKMKIEAEVHV
jgi:hypothetical protein